MTGWIAALLAHCMTELLVNADLHTTDAAAGATPLRATAFVDVDHDGSTRLVLL